MTYVSACRLPQRSTTIRNEHLENTSHNRVMVLDDHPSGRPALQVLIVADDLTGACDAAVAFAVGRGSVSRVQAVSTESRDLAKQEIVQRMQSIARAEGHADLIFKKIDSTLRGNVEAEIAAAMDAFQCDGAIITPAFPDMGRAVKEGHLHVDGVRVRYAGAGMMDAVTNQDLDRLVEEGLKMEGRVLWAGSGGLAAALARRLCGTLQPRHAPTINGPVAFCIGSDHPATQAQHAELVRRFPDAMIVPIVLGKTTASEIRQSLQGAGALFITGGDTASVVLRAVGAREIAVQQEVVTGVPWGLLFGGQFDGYPVVTKSGGFGGRDALISVGGFFPSSGGPADTEPPPCTSDVRVLIPALQTVQQPS